MCNPMAVMAAATAVGVANSVYQGEQSRKQQSRAADAATKEADRAFNKDNQKNPDVMGLADANKLAASGGVGNTMLTGPMGIDPNLLNLGKTTLLGGS